MFMMIRGGHAHQIDPGARQCHQLSTSITIDEETTMMVIFIIQLSDGVPVQTSLSGDS